MRRISMLIALQLFALLIYAQRRQPANPERDKMVYMGYTIKLIPLVNDSYGYEITRGKELIALQAQHPFTALPVGLTRKEDAYAVAKWQIRGTIQEEHENRQPAKGDKRGALNDKEINVKLNPMLDRKVAAELGIHIQVQ